MLPGIIAGGALALAGGILGNESREDQQNAALAEARGNAARSDALQREFAQHGILWKVNDAKSAGLHPLYALGGSGATYTPSAQNVSFGGQEDGVGRALSDMGQNVSRAAMARATPEMQELQALQRELLKAQIGETDARREGILIDNARKRAPGSPPSTVLGAYGSDVASMVGPATGSSDSAGIPISAHPLFKDAVRLEPDPMVSRHFRLDGQTAGEGHPPTREFTWPGGFKTLLPATGGGGVPEEIDVSMLPFLIGANVERYGYRWLADAAAYFGGLSPRRREQELDPVQMKYRLLMERYFGGRPVNPKRDGLK